MPVAALVVAGPTPPDGGEDVRSKASSWVSEVLALTEVLRFLGFPVRGVLPTSPQGALADALSVSLAAAGESGTLIMVVAGQATPAPLGRMAHLGRGMSFPLTARELRTHVTGVARVVLIDACRPAVESGAGDSIEEVLVVRAGDGRAADTLLLRLARVLLAVSEKPGKSTLRDVLSGLGQGPRRVRLSLCGGRVTESIVVFPALNPGGFNASARYGFKVAIEPPEGELPEWALEHVRAMVGAGGDVRAAMTTPQPGEWFMVCACKRVTSSCLWVEVSGHFSAVADAFFACSEEARAEEGGVREVQLLQLRNSVDLFAAASFTSFPAFDEAVAPSRFSFSPESRQPFCYESVVWDELTDPPVCSSPPLPVPSSSLPTPVPAPSSVSLESSTVLSVPVQPSRRSSRSRRLHPRLPGPTSPFPGKPDDSWLERAAECRAAAEELGVLALPGPLEEQHGHLPESAVPSPAPPSPSPTPPTPRRRGKLTPRRTPGVFEPPVSSFPPSSPVLQPSDDPSSSNSPSPASLPPSPVPPFRNYQPPTPLELPPSVAATESNRLLSPSPPSRSEPSPQRNRGNALDAVVSAARRAMLLAKKQELGMVLPALRQEMTPVRGSPVASEELVTEVDRMEAWYDGRAMPSPLQFWPHGEVRDIGSADDGQVFDEEKLRFALRGAMLNRHGMAWLKRKRPVT